VLPSQSGCSMTSRMLRKPIKIRLEIPIESSELQKSTFQSSNVSAPPIIQPVDTNPTTHADIWVEYPGSEVYLRGFERII
jgi:hypothetical protein